MFKFIQIYHFWVSRRLNLVANLTAENLALRQQRKKYGIHPASFRFTNVAKRPKNTGYQAVAIFPNHQVIPRLRQIPYTTVRQANVGATLADTKIAAHALHGNLVAAGSIA